MFSNSGGVMHEKAKRTGWREQQHARGESPAGGLRTKNDSPATVWAHEDTKEWERTLWDINIANNMDSDSEEDWS